MTTQSTTWLRPRRTVAAMLAALALVLAACGSEPIPISAPVNGESAAAPASQASSAPVGIAETDLGQILVNEAGFSLYGFTNDVDGESACYDGCASAWPPIVVPSAQLPADLDPAIFSVTERTDGTHQLKAGKWPLYLFAGDTAAGQTTGHLSGDVWFLAAPDGSLIGVEPAVDAEPDAGEAAETAADAEPASATSPALVSVGSSDLGEVLVNEADLTLYGFTNDVDGVPTCEGGCAQAWPPILLDSGELPADLDASIFSVVARPDGTNQLKAGKWPLYLFAGDTAPGQTTGHLSGDVWFAIAPSGALIDAPGSEDLADSEDAPADGDAEADGGYDYGDTTESADSTALAIGTASSDVGDILVDAQGLSLYGFTNDADGVPTCDGGCAEAWPPVLLASPELPAGLDAAVFSVAERSDGTHQLKAGKWPLYRFAGDTAAGQTTGHLSGDVWFLASPSGGLIGVAAAQAAPTATQPPAAAPAVPPAPTATPAPAATPIPAQPTATADAYGSDY